MTIAVIGGGIAGLSLALCLARRGVEAHVFERAPEVREAGAGVSLWPNATRLLRQWGLLDRCLELAAPLSVLELRSRHAGVFLRTEVDRSDSPTLCMRRPELLAALLSQVPSDAIHVQHNCTSVFEADGHMGVTFERQGTKLFDAVVGADGLRSAVRKYVAPDAGQPVSRGYACWRGIAELSLPQSTLGKMSETWGQGRRLGILPIVPGTVCWYATVNRPIPESATPLALFAGWPEPIESLIRATPPPLLIESDATDLPRLSRWSRSRAVLIGDAAHAITPNLGQGCCLALEDASVLARLLSEPASPTAARDSLGRAFEAFARLRKGRIERIVALSRWLGAVVQLDGQWAAGRDRATPLVAKPVFELLVRSIHAWRDRSASAPASG